MTDCTTIDIINQAWRAAQLAVGGGIFAIGALTIAQVMRILNRWRHWDE